MASVKPFAAVRARPDLAHRICELPYDVMTSEEARLAAADNPVSFLRVSKPEIECPPEMGPYDAEVYVRGRANFRRMILDGALVCDARPRYYLYRQVMVNHVQTGFVALASCEDYLNGVIRKHELTRRDKEDDRTRHIQTIMAQTGPAFLVYRAEPSLDHLMERVMVEVPDVDFTAADRVRHTVWGVGDAKTIERVEESFREVPFLYIADGHHRSAAAVRVYEERGGKGGSAGFLAVMFPHDQVQVMAYHRVLTDLNGRTPGQLLADLEACVEIRTAENVGPNRKHEMGLFLDGRWHALTFRVEQTETGNLADTLDAALLQRHVLAPLFGIHDPRTDQRLQHVGGIRGPGELERLVRSGAAACAFALYPTRIEDLMAIADAGEIMPPKSTWFEPKLRDGLFCHVLD